MKKMIEIKNGDCLQLMQRLPAGSVDFILTDLPYGIMNYSADRKINLAEMWQEFKRLLKPRCVVALFASSKFTFEVAASNLDWYKYKFIWVKNFSTNFVNAKNRPLSKYEEILIFSNGTCVHEGQSENRMKYFPQGLKKVDVKKHNGNTVCLKGNVHKKSKVKFGKSLHKSPSNVDEYVQEYGNYPTDVLYFDAPPQVKRLHPNQKPVALLEHLIKTYTQEGETVLDATMGSGGTGVAAINTGRNFIGYELDDKYFDIAADRIGQALRESSARLF